MQTIRIKQFIYLLTAALVFGACSEDQRTDQSASGEPVTVSLSLQVSEMQQVNLSGSFSPSSLQARSVTALGDKAEKVINNLWVFEYADGAYVRSQYLSQVNVDKLSLDLTTASSANIYFVANVGEAAYKGKTLATETSFQNYNLRITDEASITPSAGYLPMFKVLKSVSIPDYFKSGTTVTLDYMVSRVDLTYKSANFVLKQARLINVPCYLYPYIDPDIVGSTTFPTDTLTTQNFVREDLANGTTGTLTFYLPDNRRGGFCLPDCCPGVGRNTAAIDAILKAGIKNATAVQLIGYKDGDEITYNIYLGGDQGDSFIDYNLKRNTKYTLTADLRVPPSQMANTYVVKPGGTVSIPVKRANESDLGVQLADVSTGWTPGILWRDNSSLTISATDAGNGLMEVTASSATATGNAVVFIKDGSGKILWSWQIWVTDYDPSSENETYDGYTFMDRNLGATSDVAGNVDALGLLYQWGRKDPFAGSSATTANNTTLKALYSGGSGSTVYSSENTAAPTTSANNLETAIRNPGVFYFAESSGDWYTGSSRTQNDALWGATKTVYDPCPSGWKVAPLVAFSTWSAGTSTWDTTNLGSTFTAASGSWYPAAGLRISTTRAFNVGTSGNYWSAAVIATNASYLSFSSSGVSPSNRSNRASGFAMRCVQD